jgi:multidrug efflux pump subunit AcrA (membrane-fusion protein)
MFPKPANHPAAETMKQWILPAVCPLVHKRVSGWLGCCLAGWLVLGLSSTATAQSLPPAPVVVAKVQQRQLATGQTFVGTVMPLRTSTVGTQVDGEVVELLVNEGDAVKKGQPLAKLRTRQLEIQLASAKAELAFRRQQLAELENGSRPEEIQQAYAEMLAARALREFTQSRLKRTQSLFQRNAATEDDLQENVSAAEGAHQSYLGKKAAWELAKAGPREEKIEQARAQALAQQEEVHRLEDQITQHTIAAPFDGHVTNEYTEVGQWISRGNPVVEVVEVQTVEIEVQVLENYIPKLRVGTTAQVMLGALPGKTWQAPVALIVPKADVRSRNFPVKVRLPNEPGPGGVLLKPGMFAQVTLPVGDESDVLMVPKDAVVLERPPIVYVVDPMPANPQSKDARPGGGAPAAAPAGPPPSGLARRVTVELGAAADDLIEVRGNLKPGEQVVVEGNERLFPGAPVMIVN